MSSHAIPEATGRASRLADRLVEAGALFLLVFTPLAFGTVQPWSEAVAEMVILAIVVAWVVGSVGRRELRADLPPGWLPAALFLGLVLFQTVPMPRGLVEMISPAFAAVNRDLSAYTASLPSFMPFSMAPYETWHDALKLLGIAAFFLLVYNTYRTRAQATRAIWTMMIMGTAIALVGLAQRTTWTGRLYWVGPEAPPNADPFGPFVNRTHFAGLMALVVPMALALIMPGGPDPRPSRRPMGWRDRLRVWSSAESGPTRLVPVLILVMGGTALVSRSRGGVVSVIAALLCMIALGAQGRRGTGRVRRVAVVAGLMVLAAIWISGDVLYGTIGRLAEEVGRPEQSFRLRLWTEALWLWRDAPVLGTGLGTFGLVFPRVQSLQSPTAMTHAESDWVQLLTDTGMVGLGLALATLVSLSLALFGRFRHAGSPWSRSLALAGLVALVGAAVQGIANYNLPIMSNQLYLALILALALRSPDQAASIVNGRDR